MSASISVRGGLHYTWESRDDFLSDGEHSEAEPTEEGQFALTAESVQKVIGLPPGDVTNQHSHRRARSIIVVDETVVSDSAVPVADGHVIDVLHMFQEGMKVRNRAAAPIYEDEVVAFPFQLAKLSFDNLGIVFHNFVFPLKKASRRRSSSFTTQDIQIQFKDISCVKAIDGFTSVFSLKLDKTCTLSKLYGVGELELEVEHHDELAIWVRGIEQFLLMELRGTLGSVEEILVSQE
eukprot:TRINITY_DN239_c0_g2_i1.p3 TRINITY_DN239_c0_g2~~TRINITY_DN239_c0_g2_i1.p3  ORF type:complete len:236 (-),score=63.06 TRINITY_DN239_c0_g2_i1:2152-2859(-)